MLQVNGRLRLLLICNGDLLLQCAAFYVGDNLLLLFGGGGVGQLADMLVICVPLHLYCVALRAVCMYIMNVWHD